METAVIDDCLKKLRFTPTLSCPDKQIYMAATLLEANMDTRAFFTLA